MNANQKHIDLTAATNHSDWSTASKILTATVGRLDAKGHPLWTHEQVSKTGLTSTYQLDELFFITREEQTLGLVFLQQSDTTFWPEVAEGTSLFIHKLAIRPEHTGQGHAAQALNLILAKAKETQKEFVRLDCDDREPLRRFYEYNGFDLVDRKTIDGFNIVRYQKPT